MSVDEILFLLCNGRTAVLNEYNYQTETVFVEINTGKTEVGTLTRKFSSPSKKKEKEATTRVSFASQQSKSLLIVNLY